MVGPIERKNIMKYLLRNSYEINERQICLISWKDEKLVLIDQLRKITSVQSGDGYRRINALL